MTSESFSCSFYILHQAEQPSFLDLIIKEFYNDDYSLILVGTYHTLEVKGDNCQLSGLNSDNMFHMFQNSFGDSDGHSLC